jgi:hypothetical protein
MFVHKTILRAKSSVTGNRFSKLQDRTTMIAARPEEIRPLFVIDYTPAFEFCNDA